MKKLLKIFGCSKRKTISLTKTTSSTGNNNAASKIFQKEMQITANSNNDSNTQKEEIITKPENDIKEQEKEVKEEEVEEAGKQEIDKDEQWLLPKDSPLITDYEKGIIDFSPNGLGRFIEALDQSPNLKPLYNKQCLEIKVNMSGSPITSEFGLIKSVYKQKKSELGSNANIPNILRLMFRAEDRANWDKVLKLVKRYEGDDKMFIIRTWAVSFPMISEREGIEKRMIFNYKGVPHVFSTSVRPDYIPPEKDVVRIVNYLDIFKITEDEEYYYFTSFTQSDFKMPIPQFLMNLFLPKTTLDWFAKFQKVAAQTILEPL